MVFISNSQLTKGDIVYYARIMPNLGIFDVYDIKIRTTNTNEYFNVGRQNEGGMTHDVGEMTAEELKEARKYMLNNLPKQTGKLQDYYEKVK